MSAGVRIQTRICLASEAVSRVSTAANPRDSQTQLATYLRRSSKSRAPNLWATGMENPLHTPMQKPMIRKFTEPVAPTAARLSVPRKRPTITVSTRL